MTRDLLTILGCSRIDAILDLVLASLRFVWIELWSSRFQVLRLVLDVIVRFVAAAAFVTGR